MTTSAYGPQSSELPAAVNQRSTVVIDGIRVFAGTAEAAATACIELAYSRRGGRVATANLDFLALARRDPRLRSDLVDSTLVVADGMPVVWLGKLAGATSIQRLAGVDLVREFFADRGGPVLKVAIYGSTAAIAAKAAAMLEASGPGARVVHVANPPFRSLTQEEVEAFRKALVSAQPDVILVALGCPAQERLIAEWFNDIPSAVWVGIGGTLDFYAGLRKRAPKAAQRFGLEWAIRMAQEPRRLGKRYILRDVPALVRITPGCLRTRLTAAKRFV